MSQNPLPMPQNPRVHRFGRDGALRGVFEGFVETSDGTPVAVFATPSGSAAVPLSTPALRSQVNAANLVRGADTYVYGDGTVYQRQADLLYETVNPYARSEEGLGAQDPDGHARVALAHQVAADGQAASPNGAPVIGPDQRRLVAAMAAGNPLGGGEPEPRKAADLSNRQDRQPSPGGSWRASAAQAAAIAASRDNALLPDPPQAPSALHMAAQAPARRPVDLTATARFLQEQQRRTIDAANRLRFERAWAEAVDLAVADDGGAGDVGGIVFGRDCDPDTMAAVLLADVTAGELAAAEAIAATLS